MFRATTIRRARRNGATVADSGGDVRLGGSVLVKHSANMPQSSSGGELGVKAAGPVAHTEGLRGCCDSDRKAQGRSLRRAASVFAQGWGIALPLRILDAVMVATDKARLWISKDGCIVAEQDSGLIAAGALPKNPGVEDGAIGQESRRIGPRVREVVHDRIEMETVE